MKLGLLAFALGIAALIVQGALARTIPPPWCPDLALLVVVGIGLRWPTYLQGLIIAVALGYSMDLVSGSLMGQHALLRMVSFSAAYVAARQLDLSGALPVSIFVFALTVFYGVAIVATLTFFSGSEGVGLPLLGSAVGHGVANVLAAGMMISLVERLLARLSEDEGGRRSPLPMGYQRRGVG